MNKPRPWQHVVLTLLSAITFLGLCSTPYNRYEWMLEDPQAKAEGLNYCALPTDPGEPTWEALAYLLPWALLATTISLKQRRLHASVWYCLGLLACWGVRFGWLTPAC